MTQIWFETPKRLAATLKMMAESMATDIVLLRVSLQAARDTLSGHASDLAKQFEVPLF